MEKSQYYINNVSLDRESIEDYCDQVEATEYERHHIMIKFDAAYERADFIKSLGEFGPTQKFIQPDGK